MISFYSCSVGEEDKGYDKENLERIIHQTAFVLHESTPQKGDYSKIKEGDILLLKYRKQFIAYGEAKSIFKSDGEEWNLCAPVEEWYFLDKNNFELGVPIYGMSQATLSGSQYGTVKPLDKNFSIEKIKQINNSSKLYKDLIQMTILEEQDKIKSLLLYKKQIILQGPPGTGKTRLAKEIGEELTKGNKQISMYEYVENYIEKFKHTDKTLKLQDVSKELLEEFQETFTTEVLSELSLDEYALGNGSQESFCHWIETKLAPLCKFSPGQKGTIVYGISYIKDTGEVRLQNDYTQQEYMAELRLALSELVNNQNYQPARDMSFWFSYILKILNSYYPDDYFPVLSKDHLKLFAKIFRVETRGLNDIQINKEINSKFLELKAKYNSEISSTLLMRHLYDKFDLKNSGYQEHVSHSNAVNISGEYKIIQFHPSYTYEDFVRGIVAESIEGNINYKVIDKTLAEFSKKALLNPEGKYVLIIDEINRANLSSVLGELIYALEYRYKFNAQKKEQIEAQVDSLYSIKSDDLGDDDRTLSIPENLFIIGTMNTADRSVGHVDYAIRRRFAFVDVLPRDLSEDSSIIFHKKLFNTVKVLFTKDDNYISKSDFISEEFEPKDVALGHSYFIDQSEDGGTMDIRLEYEIKPILLEYIKDGILKEAAKAEIEKLKVS